MKIKYIIIFLILVFSIINLYYIFNNNYEHASSVTNNILSNEAIQNMSSVLNSGNGTITNLTITGQLKIGNLTINPDGTIIGTINNPTINNPTISNPTINNPIISNPTLNNPTLNNGTINNPILTWPTTNNKWNLSTEGDNLVIRNMMAKTDSRFAFGGDGNWNFGNTISGTGNIVGGGIISNGDMIFDHCLYSSNQSKMWCK